MTHIDLEVFRRLLFFSAPEAAMLLGRVSEQAWRRWEAGTRKIPTDVQREVLRLLSWRNATITSLSRDLAQDDRANMVPLLWYESIDDWGRVGDRVLFRPYQSACAAVADANKNKVRLVRFDASAYSDWLNPDKHSDLVRNDSEDLRLAWAKEALEATTPLADQSS